MTINVPTRAERRNPLRRHLSTIVLWTTITGGTAALVALAALVVVLAGTVAR